MNILILHGPNLNLLGTREPEVYGTVTLDEINDRLQAIADQEGAELRVRQSNHEGELVDALHASREWADGIVINAGALTHYGYSLRDAIQALRIPAVEVHMSNVHKREEFRHRSVLAGVCLGQVVGFGWRSYTMGLTALIEILKEKPPD